MRNIGKRKQWQWQWQWLGLEQDLNYGAQWETGALRWHYISGKHIMTWETITGARLKLRGAMGNWGSNGKHWH